MVFLWHSIIMSPHLNLWPGHQMSYKRSNKCCDIADSSPEANIVVSKAGVWLWAAVSHHSCRTPLKITRTCYIVFLSLPKPLALKQDRVPQAFGYVRDINTHQSTDPKIYIQQISLTIFSCLFTRFSWQHQKQSTLFFFPSFYPVISLFF